MTWQAILLGSSPSCHENSSRLKASSEVYVMKKMKWINVRITQILRKYLFSKTNMLKLSEFEINILQTTKKLIKSEIIEQY